MREIRHLQIRMFWIIFAYICYIMKISSKILLIAAAGIGYYIFNRSTSLEDELKELREEMYEGDSNAKDYTDEKTINHEDLIQKSIKITPYLQIGQFGKERWSMQMVWKLKNVSTKYTYVITGIKSVVTILGYTCKKWMPGNTATFVTLRPGAEATIYCNKNEYYFYNERETRLAILDEVGGNYEDLDILDTVTNLRVQSVFGESTVATYQDLQGYVQNIKGKYYFQNDDGHNMVDEEL